MSVNFYDAVDTADLLLPRRIMRWLVRLTVVVLLLLLWSPLLSMEQVSTFMVQQGTARAEATLNPIVERIMDSLPTVPPTSAAPTTTLLPPAATPGT